MKLNLSFNSATVTLLRRAMGLTIPKKDYSQVIRKSLDICDKKLLFIRIARALFTKIIRLFYLSPAAAFKANSGCERDSYCV